MGAKKIKESIYDVEVFPNFVCIAVEDPFTDVKEYMYVAEGKWYNKELLRRLVHEDYLFDFNGRKYDVFILNAMWQYQNDPDFHLKIYTMSKNMVNTPFGHRHPYENSRPRLMQRQVDLMVINGIQKSLKLTGVGLKHPKLQDLPYPFDTELTKAQMKKVLKYNFNDTSITKLIYHAGIDELEKRIQLSNLYRINLLSDKDATIATKIVKKWILKYNPNFDFQHRVHYDEIHLKDVIEPQIKFKTEKFKNFLYHLKNNVEYYEAMAIPDKEKEQWKHDNMALEVNEHLTLQFGFGGIHSCDGPAMFICPKGWIIRDADVGSQYPARIINKGYIPSHFPPEVCQEYEVLRDDRIADKKAKRKGLANGKKVVINSFYGLMGSQTFFRDHKRMLQVTLNNQLSLAMLIERLLMAGIEVISANTDGLVCAFPKEMEAKYQSICASWEKFEGLELEYADYTKYIRRDVNNYFAVFPDGYVKKKGIFTGPTLKTAFNMPVIGDAAFEHLMGNKNYMEYMVEADIYDFCRAVKIGEKFDNFYHPATISVNPYGKRGQKLKHPKVEYHFTEEEPIALQNSVRFFIAREGGKLFKRHVEKQSDTTHCADRLVSVFNDYRDVNVTEEVDMPFYFEKALDIITPIESGMTMENLRCGKPRL